MPLIMVCSLCGRSEADIRAFELTFRGYTPDRPHNSRNMRRVKAGSADLCERCLKKLCGDASRDFKSIDGIVTTPPRRYVRTKFSNRLENSPESAQKAE